MLCSEFGKCSVRNPTSIQLPLFFSKLSASWLKECFELDEFKGFKNVPLAVLTNQNNKQLVNHLKAFQELEN